VRARSCIVLLVAVTTVACHPTPNRTLSSVVTPIQGPRRVVRVTARELVLDMSKACVRRVSYLGPTHFLHRLVEPAPCGGGEGERVVRVDATSPWGRRIPVELRGDTAVVPVDWTDVGDDPFDPELPDRLRGTWRFEAGRSTWQWTPTPAEITLMIQALGDAIDTQIAVEHGGPPPELAVTELVVEGAGALRLGEPSRVRLTITNRGKGSAYRVIGTTRSSHPRLHGLRFSFGLVRPGATKTRVREVTIPMSEYEPEVTTVVVFSEADGFGPPNHVARLAVIKVARPALALSCELDGDDTGKVAAGQRIRITCKMRNEGQATARDLVVTATLAGSSIERKEVALDPAREATVHLPLYVPFGVREGERLSVTVDAREPEFGTSTSTTVALVVSTAAVCRERLSRDDFNERRRKLSDLRDQGALSREEFEKFEAELVQCLE